MGVAVEAVVAVAAVQLAVVEARRAEALEMAVLPLRQAQVVVAVVVLVLVEVERSDSLLLHGSQQVIFQKSPD